MVQLVNSGASSEGRIVAEDDLIRKTTILCDYFHLFLQDGGLDIS